MLVTGVAILVATEYREHPTLQGAPKISKKTVLEIFFDGEYEDFLELTKDQSKEKKLEWRQFEDIKERARIYRAGEACSQRAEIVSLLQTDVEICLNTLKDLDLIEKNREVFEAAFFEYLTQEAENNRALFTKEIYNDLLRLRKSILLLETESSEAAFSYYVTRFQGFLDLDRRSVLDRYLLKEAIKNHIYTKQEIQKVKDELLAKSSEEICQIIHGVHGAERHYLESQEYLPLLK